MKFITPKLGTDSQKVKGDEKYKIFDTPINTYLFGHFVKTISFFKWNWQRKQKLTIEAEMKLDDFKKFLSNNGVVVNGDLNSIYEAKIVIKVKGSDNAMPKM